MQHKPTPEQTSILPKSKKAASKETALFGYEKTVTV